MNKVYAKSKENQSIIKALNMYGRVPEQWELLNEIKRLEDEIAKLTAENTEWESKYYDLQKENDRLNNIIDELEKEFNWQLKKQIDIDKFADEQGFLNYNPVRLMVECFINKLQKLKENK